jgi:hypothetical protein
VFYEKTREKTTRLFSGNFILITEDAEVLAMSKTEIDKPNCCAICSHYLTTSEEYAGQRCLDPGHWQAAGVLASTDFYSMARLAAQTNVELNRRFETGRYSGLITGQCPKQDGSDLLARRQVG